MKNIIGWAMMVLLFTGVFAIMAIQTNIKIAALTFALTAIMVLFIWVAINLILD